MPSSDTLLVRLQDLSQFMAHGNLNDSLDEYAGLAARTVGADTCSIMLINDGSGEDLRMSVYASYGELPAAAWTSTVGRGEGIAGQVLASGQPLLIHDITRSAYAHLARRSDDPRRSLMLAPIRLDDKIIGLVNVSCSHCKADFSDEDLHMLSVLSLFIGKAVQVQQLQTILNSRFVQLAMLDAQRGEIGNAAFQQPEQLARILARSFYKEMHRAGFNARQIVQAATEIISSLNDKLHDDQRSNGKSPEDSTLH